MRVTSHEFELFQRVIRNEIPGFKLGYKDQSSLMKVFAFLLYPFNDSFLDGYVTTWGTTVYFPNPTEVRIQPSHSFRVLAHEFVHLCDSKKGRLGFMASYALPQILALLPLLAYAWLGSPLPLLLLVVGYLLGAFLAPKSRLLFWLTFGPTVLAVVVLGWLLSGFWTLLIFVAVGLLFLPSPGRTKWELRGYTMTLAVFFWLLRRQPSAEDISHITEQFTGPAYLYMCRDESKIRKALYGVFLRVRDGSLQREYPYNIVHEFIVRYDLRN